MAFHFNWSPLIADTDRVRHMLTSSLNRSPKPPIIVGDILVNELNLGQTPPSLEILEIGDLAEDRFRGIFKVKYEGDAYLQLQTKVQANPLNTFLSTKPSFASPNPLAAGSGLTIPLQITLSDIRLSGFVILVFNKQKGITLVFRNDPLESLKVSSTFDTIPFVRDYLQKTIEEQLRVLFVEDLPAIIHRLSLRVFNSEFENTEGSKSNQDEQNASESVEPVSNPVKSSTGEEGVVTAPAGLFDGDTDASFSQTNLLRLAALTESQRTLSLFTPSIRDTVYRAWASAHERDQAREGADTPVHMPPSLSRIQSQQNMPHSTCSSAASQTSDSASQITRPSLASRGSVSTTYSFGSGRTRGHGARKKKHRVVNLRKKLGSGGDGTEDTMSMSSGYTESESRSESVSASGSTNPGSPEATSTYRTSTLPSSAHLDREGEIHTPSWSPKKKVGFRQPTRHTDDPVVSLANEISTASESQSRSRPMTPRHQRLVSPTEDIDSTPRASTYLVPQEPSLSNDRDKRPSRMDLPRSKSSTNRQPTYEKTTSVPRTASEMSISDLAPAFNLQSGSSGGILEQAWMMKMATEIARRVAEEKETQSQSQPPPHWRRSTDMDDGDQPPPAYFK